MKEPIILVGGGGHCKAVIDVIEMGDRFFVYGIVDTEENKDKQILGYPVKYTDADLEFIYKNVKNAVVTVGHIYTNQKRIKLYKILKEIGYNLPNIISPLAYVSKHAVLGEGNVIMHYAVVNADAKIGNNCILNTKSLVEHDAVIEDHCHIATGAIVNGGVVVKSGTFFGSNATSKEYTHAAGFIKAGSVVK